MMTLDSDPSSLSRHELGFYLPSTIQSTAGPPLLPYVRTYLTYSELTDGEPMPETEIIAQLKRMSAADCLLALAQLGTRLFAGDDQGIDGRVQHELVDQVVGNGLLARAMHDKLADPRWSALFCEQQLVHLARLVIRHADRRPPDDFNGGETYAEWVTCLLAVNDLLDAGLEVEDRDARLAWEIRQAALNHQAEQLPTTAIHYELYSVLWPQMLPEPAAGVERAFQRMSGMSIGDYFTVGSAVMAHLTIFGHTGQGAPLLRPDVYHRPRY